MTGQGVDASRCVHCGALCDPTDAICVACGRPTAQRTAPPLTPPTVMPFEVPPTINESPMPPVRDKSKTWIWIAAVVAVAVVIAIAATSGDDGGSSTRQETFTPAQGEPSGQQQSGGDSSDTQSGGVAQQPNAGGDSSGQQVGTGSLSSASYPTQIPGSFCSAQSIASDTSVSVAFDPQCFGAWAVSMSCRVGSPCDSADVFRWTDAGWTYRGEPDAGCPTNLTVTGMPPTIAKHFVGIEDPCKPRIVYGPASSSGPLTLGDQGPRVSSLQGELISRGLLLDASDGDYGPNTWAAVVDFQFLAGLSPTGTADEEVLSFLDQYF